MALLVAEPARWAISVMFGLSGCWYLVALLRMSQAAWQEAVGNGAHASMSFAMIAMSWTWGARIPASIEIIVFTTATVWFAAQVFLHTVSARDAISNSPGDGSCGRTAPSPAGAGQSGASGTASTLTAAQPEAEAPTLVRTRQRTLADLYNLATMAAMAWLGIVMSTSQPIAAAAVIDSHRDVGAVMAGLPPRTSTGVSNSGAGGMGMLSSTGWISVSCLLLGAGFLAAVGWFLAAATRSPGGGEGPFNRRHLAHNGIQALTSLGMAVVLREMA